MLTIRKSGTAAALTALALVTTTAWSQYVGPGAGKGEEWSTARTVQEVIAARRDDQSVVLTGHIVRKTGREEYLFRDGTGEIRIEIDTDDFPAGQPIDAETRVVIEGEVDVFLGRDPEVDVERIRIVGAETAG